MSFSTPKATRIRDQEALAMPSDIKRVLVQKFFFYFEEQIDFYSIRDKG